MPPPVATPMAEAAALVAVPRILGGGAINFWEVGGWGRIEIRKEVDKQKRSLVVFGPVNNEIDLVEKG